MLIVALTGSIATGKSIVADIFREHGCYVYSADQAAHETLEPGGTVWEKIVARFGEAILNPDKTIDRAKLGDILFRDRKARRFVESLVHPLVLNKKKKAAARLEKEGLTNIFVSEAALTIEAGFASFFDKIVVTWCPEKIQVERLMTRDGISRGAAIRKVRSQMPAEEKKNYADYVIDTSGALEEMIAQTERVYARLLEDYRIKQQHHKTG
jgi:dephospho-CoA kinase